MKHLVCVAGIVAALVVADASAAGVRAGAAIIFIVPDQDLVIVTTSRSDASRERRDHLDTIYKLALDIVLMH